MAKGSSAQEPSWLRWELGTFQGRIRSSTTMAQFTSLWAGSGLRDHLHLSLLQEPTASLPCVGESCQIQPLTWAELLLHWGVRAARAWPGRWAAAAVCHVEGGMDARQLRHLHPSGVVAILLQRRCSAVACVWKCSHVAWPWSLSPYHYLPYGTQIIFSTSEKLQRTKPQSVAAPSTQIAGCRGVHSAWGVSFDSCFQAPQSKGHQKLSFALNAPKIQIFA